MFQKRIFQSNSWRKEGSLIEFSDSKIYSIFATNEHVFISLQSGRMEIVEIATWQKSSSPYADLGDMAASDFCVLTPLKEDPSDFKSACVGLNPYCGDGKFCFDVEGTPTCYCPHETRAVTSTQSCPRIKIL